MSKLRASSQHNSPNSVLKPTFQTKLKGRPGAELSLNVLNSSYDTTRMSKTERHFNHHSDPLKEDLFNKTSSKLNDANFGHLPDHK